MKSIITIIVFVFAICNLHAQQWQTKVMPGNIRVDADSITLYPLSKSIHGVKVIHIDRLLRNDSLTLVYYLQKLNVKQEAGKLYLKNNEVVRIFFYRNYLKGWQHGTPKGIDSTTFINYLKNSTE